jgi:hypothetical protein
MNLLRRARGSGTLFYRNLAINVKDAILLEPQLDPFAVESDAWGALDQRKNNTYLQLQFTPLGVVSQDALDVLLPFRKFQAGQYNTPLLPVVSVAGAVITSPGHGLRVGDGVIIGLSSTDGADELYGVTAVDVGAFTVDRELPALPAGSRWCAQVQNELVLWTHDNFKVRIHNSAISQMPELNLTAGDTFWGQCTVEGYRRGDTETPENGEGLVYTVTVEPFPGAVPENTAQIPTVPYTLEFAQDGQPVQRFEMRDPLKVGFDQQANDVSADRVGLIARSIQNLSATATLVPVNRDAFDLLDAVNAQNQARGSSLPCGTLTIKGPGDSPCIVLYGAQLTKVPLKISSGDDRVGEIQFKTRRTFTPAGANPVFYAGMQPPA